MAADSMYLQIMRKDERIVCIPLDTVHRQFAAALLRDVAEALGMTADNGYHEVYRREGISLSVAD
jgi:hypothetical protein